MAGCFLLVILAVGDDDQHARRDRLPRAVRVIDIALALETIEGLVRCVPMHRPLVARYTMVNPDMIIVGIEKQSLMLARSCSLHRRVLVNVDTFSGHKHTSTI